MNAGAPDATSPAAPNRRCGTPRANSGTTDAHTRPPVPRIGRVTRSHGRDRTDQIGWHMAFSTDRTTNAKTTTRKPGTAERSDTTRSRGSVDGATVLVYVVVALTLVGIVLGVVVSVLIQP